MHLRRKYREYGDTFFIDDVFVKISGGRHYLRRAADRHGEAVNVGLQVKRDGATVKRLFRRSVRAQHYRDLRVSAFSELSSAVA
jgi:putative transposase